MATGVAVMVMVAVGGDVKEEEATAAAAKVEEGAEAARWGTGQQWSLQRLQ